MQDLYSQGWRQGSVFLADLEVNFVDLSADGTFGSGRRSFQTWIVCSQECELSTASTESTDPVVEIRPVLPTEKPTAWGVRSRLFRVSETEAVAGDHPRTHITPVALEAARVTRRPALPDGHAKAFKTWLGRRYDRPALPPALVDIGQEVARRCDTRGAAKIGERVHEVLMQFDESKSPPHVALFAILTDDSEDQHAEEVRRWLSDASRRIDTDLGVVAHIAAATRSMTSLGLIETSYAADLSQMTWGTDTPRGT